MDFGNMPSKLDETPILKEPPIKFSKRRTIFQGLKPALILQHLWHD